MSELKKCFAALGFTELPATEQEIIDRCGKKMQQIQSNTESDKLARQLLRENRDLCIAELRRQT